MQMWAQLVQYSCVIDLERPLTLVARLIDGRAGCSSADGTSAKNKTEEINLDRTGQPCINNVTLMVG